MLFEHCRGEIQPVDLQASPGEGLGGHTTADPHVQQALAGGEIFITQSEQQVDNVAVISTHLGIVVNGVGIVQWCLGVGQSSLKFWSKDSFHTYSLSGGILIPTDKKLPYRWGSLSWLTG